MSDPAIRKCPQYVDSGRSLNVDSVRRGYVGTLATASAPFPGYVDIRGPNDKIRWIVDVRRDEIQHCTIDLGRSGSIRSKMRFRRSVAAVVQNANRRIIAFGNRCDPYFRFRTPDRHTSRSH
jgi:hypothetical protein